MPGWSCFGSRCTPVNEGAIGKSPNKTRKKNKTPRNSATPPNVAALKKKIANLTPNQRSQYYNKIAREKRKEKLGNGNGEKNAKRYPLPPIIPKKPIGHRPSSLSGMYPQTPKNPRNTTVSKVNPLSNAEKFRRAQLKNLYRRLPHPKIPSVTPSFTPSQPKKQISQEEMNALAHYLKGKEEEEEEEEYY